MSLLVTSFDFKIGSEKTSLNSAVSLPVSSIENSLKSISYNWPSLNNKFTVIGL